MTVEIEDRRRSSVHGIRRFPFATVGARRSQIPWNTGTRRASLENDPVTHARGSMRTLRGIAIRPGIAVRPLVYDLHSLQPPRRSKSKQGIHAESTRSDRGLETACAEAGLDEQEVCSRLYTQYSHILAAHGRMITDPAVGCETRERAQLSGNIEFASELDACLTRGVIGVGFCRTKFVLLDDETAPSEGWRLQASAAVAQTLAGRTLTFRTLELAADKLPGYRKTRPLEPKGLLGLRSPQLSLGDPNFFRPQLRAAIRANAIGQIPILFPIVSTLVELRQARSMLDKVVAELKAERHLIGDVSLVSVMIEVSAAVLTADHLAKEVNFFSIGTNDLLQYSLAVVRTNETVSDLYCACHPVVLRLIFLVIEAARNREIEVSVRGAIGAKPLYTMFVMGMGVTQLSMKPR